MKIAEQKIIFPVFLKGMIFVLFIAYFLFGSFWTVFAAKDKKKTEATTNSETTTNASTGKTEENNAEEEARKKKREAEIKDREDKIRDEIKDIEKDKIKDEKIKWKISSEIGAINGNISKIEKSLTETANELERVELEIKRNELIIQEKKLLMAEALRKLDRMRLETSLIFLGESDNFKKYFFVSDELGKLEEEILLMVDELKQKKKEREGSKKEYSEVLEVQADQKNTLEGEKKKKDYLLNQTQKSIDKKDADIANLQAKLAKLQSELSSLLGKSYNFSDIERAVEFASKKTGVRKDFLMGMLVVESNLGRFTGGCNYKESRMSPERQKKFEAICKELGYDYKKKKVSCPPKNYKGTGGAMGVQQFMSDTWMAYRSEISSYTGNNPPDPWNLTDGVMAMALKLAKDGATKKSGEWQAASRYLGTCSTKSTRFYCDDVQYWADHYEKKL